MCLILVAWRAHPSYPLILAANRDEYFARAAAPAAWWPEPHILAGRDLQARGTWLGMRPDGRFAALTNYRDTARPLRDAPSRGALVPQTLAAAAPLEEWLAKLQASAALYNGFNLLFSDGERLAVFESVGARARLLGPGVYGLSNHLLDTPWPKVVNAKSALAAALQQLPDEQGLLELLRDDRQADDSVLPRTGIDLAWERQLSSAFVRAGSYGTRCSTIILLSAAGAVHFREWSWDAAGEPRDQVQYHFTLT